MKKSCKWSCNNVNERGVTKKEVVATWIVATKGVVAKVVA
jgi:hypothetical protein